MRITSTSVTLGNRIMTSRCEVSTHDILFSSRFFRTCVSSRYHHFTLMYRTYQITDKKSGRVIASALLSKMQPTSAPATARL